MRAKFVIEEKERVLAVCEALVAGDYETVGRKMYETHDGLSKDYEVSCEELDFLNAVARECGVTGSRIMGGGFGGCTINLVKESRDRAVRPHVRRRRGACCRANRQVHASHASPRARGCSPEG